MLCQQMPLQQLSRSSLERGRARDPRADGRPTAPASLSVVIGDTLEGRGGCGWRADDGIIFVTPWRHAGASPGGTSAQLAWTLADRGTPTSGARRDPASRP